MKRRFIYCIVLLTGLVCAAACGKKDEVLRTDRTRGLVRELLTKLDSSDVYAARLETHLQMLKENAAETDDCVARCDIYYAIAEKYANYVLDSALVYLNKAVYVAEKVGNDTLRTKVELKLSTTLTAGGFYVASKETLESIRRNTLTKTQMISYYGAWTTLYHELYSSSHEPDAFQKKYRHMYTTYRDSLLAVTDPMSIQHLRNLERKEARVGNFAEARRYNALRLSKIKNHKSREYATCIYDRFLIAYHYERNLTAEAVDDLIESAIVEVENSNHDIASLLRVEAILNDISEVKDAKKVSDYYYSSLRKFGSRKRLIEGGEQAIVINEDSFRQLQKKNKQFLMAIILTSLFAAALLVSLVVINRTLRKISKLKDNLQLSGKISKGYVGVLFKLYSSYIRRLDAFRTKIHATLKRGHVDQALELTSPSKDLISEERRSLFRKFDGAFVDIFPDYIETVNSCLKPQSQIIPKRTEILNNELRMLALGKLGIEDIEEIADMLHCSVKTVYNLRAMFKARLAVSEKEFQRIISEL